MMGIKKEANQMTSLVNHYRAKRGKSRIKGIPVGR